MTVFPRTGRTHCAAARGTVLAVAAAWGVLAPLREARAQETQSSAPRILSLSAAERAALEQQPQIRIARAQTAVAMATADEVRAPLLPQVVGTAQYQHDWGAFRGIGSTTSSTGGSMSTTTTTSASSTSTGLASLSNNYNVYSLGVNATQLLYDFGQTTEKYSAAKANVEAQRYAEEVTRVQIVAAVRKAYFVARQNKELVDVSRETLSDQQKHLAQVQGFVQVGTQPEIALAQQKAAVANAQVQLITAQNNYETAKAMLNQSAGLVGGTEYDVDDETMGALPDEDQPLETLVQKALGTRPELADLEKQRAAQEATVKAARGGYGPALSATAGASEAGLALDALGPNLNVGLLLSWPIFQGGLTIGQVRQAEAGLTTVDAQRSLEELQVRLDVNSAQLAVRAAKATIGAADDAMSSAREQLRLAEQRYATGVGSIIELNDAQVTYTSAAGQVVQARYSLATARAQLLAALGRT
jgi:outer membrane protein